LSVTAIAVSDAIPHGTLGLLAAISAGATAWAAVVAFADRALRQEIAEGWHVVRAAVTRGAALPEAGGQPPEVAAPVPAAR
jgi:hypothetical protein